MKMVVKRPTQNLTKIVCRVNQNIVLLAFRIQQLEQSLQNKGYNSWGATLLRITAPHPTPEYTAGAASGQQRSPPTSPASLPEPASAPWSAPSWLSTGGTTRFAACKRCTLRATPPLLPKPPLLQGRYARGKRGLEGPQILYRQVLRAQALACNIEGDAGDLHLAALFL